MKKTVEIVYRHPNPAVMASGPRILDYKPPGESTEYYDPDEKEIEIDGCDPIKAVVYTLNPMYARRLLSAQPERYFLLSPDRLIVPMISEHGLKTENTVIYSVKKTWKKAASPEISKTIEMTPENIETPVPTDEPVFGDNEEPYNPQEVPKEFKGDERSGIVEDVSVGTPGFSTEVSEKPTVTPLNPNPFERPPVGEE